MKRVALLLSAVLGCGGHSSRPTQRPDERPAELLLVNAHVFGSNATSLAIRDGRFAEEGSDPGRPRETRDMKGAWLFPGLRDAHVHLAAYGDVLLGRVCDLTASTSEADALARVRAFVASQKLGPEDWVRCQGWNESRWSSKRFPASTAALDEAVGDRPAILSRQDGHTGWVSKRALAIGGVTRDTAVLGGEVMKDAGGEPSGVLTDDALALVRRREPPASEAEIEAAILRALDECARLGLVEVHDALVHPRVDRVLRKLATDGRLRLRVAAMIWLPTPKLLERYMEDNPPLTRPLGDRYVARTVKVFADGSLGGASARLLSPYTSRPAWSGVSRTSRREIASIARVALRRGWQVATHAIGDAAVRDVLDGYADAGVGPAARFRVEHATLVSEEDVTRFAAMGVIASMQTGIPHAPQVLMLGEERTRHLWDTGRLARAGVHVALGTDVPPGITAEPLNGIRAALARGGVSREEAVAFASESAPYAVFADAERGGIRRGLAADLTIYDRDPLEDTSARVIGTYVGGGALDDDARARTVR